MAEAERKEGINFEPLTKQMEILTSKLAAMTTENKSLREAVETRVVPLRQYIPLNSKEGMDLLFKV